MVSPTSLVFAPNNFSLKCASNGVFNCFLRIIPDLANFRVPPKKALLLARRSKIAC